ncbi:unnamed protein product [Mytilus coruscus]|uniref:Uncharacterized protein n=1 Tax=Mytilus coruscus TaxID=42192 RepID=A0A6J8EBT1_MYTCO|nr:unnamed protein product [Mytilus coruscus]
MGSTEKITLKISGLWDNEGHIRHLTKAKIAIETVDEKLNEQERRHFIKKVKETELPIDRPVHYIPHHSVAKESSTTLKRIVYDCSCKDGREKIRQKKQELADDEQKLAEIETFCEPAPQGSLHYRCTNCHVRGHKADNNKGNSVCRNEKCNDYLSCGQKDKHKEYRDDKKKIQNRLKNIKNEIADLEDELVRATAYEAKSGNSFTKVVKDRLRKSNPTKYFQSSVLLRDVMALKTAYDNRIPIVS